RRKRRPCGGRRHPGADQSCARKRNRPLSVKAKQNHPPGMTQQVVSGFCFVTIYRVTKTDNGNSAKKSKKLGKKC
ncbi:hypothetical protein, partial [Anaerobutyricum hallii]|uniref:hypothetical protein n=1 Tax=Anaerobutyricum hallii TaxID=39488 RepID=UPI00266B8CC2